MGIEILTNIGIIGGFIFFLLLIVLGCIAIARVAQVAWETLPFKKHRGEKKEEAQLQTFADLQTQVNDLQNQLQNIAGSVSDLKTRVSKLENQQKLGTPSGEKGGKIKDETKGRVTRTPPSGGPSAERPGPR